MDRMGDPNHPWNQGRTVTVVRIPFHNCHVTSQPEVISTGGRGTLLSSPSSTLLVGTALGAATLWHFVVSKTDVNYSFFSNVRWAWYQMLDCKLEVMKSENQHGVNMLTLTTYKYHYIIYIYVCIAYTLYTLSCLLVSFRFGFARSLRFIAK